MGIPTGSRADQTLCNLFDRAGNLLVIVAIAVATMACGRLGFDETESLAYNPDEPSPYTIARIGLVHAEGGVLDPINDIVEGARFDLSSELPDPSIALEAIVLGGPAYVRFEVNDGVHDEFEAPYASTENPQGEVEHDAHLRIGSNIISASAFDNEGVLRANVTYEFYLDVPIAGTLGITDLELIDNYDGRVIRQVSSGAQVPISALVSARDEIDIRITTNPAIVGGVVTTVTGPVINTFVDDWPVYTAFGPTSGFRPMLGTYTVTTTAYELGAGLGAAGPARTITFQIVP